MPNNIDSVLPQNLLDGIQAPRDIPTRTYKLDLQEGRIIGTTDGIEAVKQAAALALLSVRFKTLIFDPQYGCEVESIIGWGSMATQELTQSEIERAIRDALSVDSRITSVGAITIQTVDDGAYVTVEISTIYGDSTLEVRY